ncbi:MAG: GNAT family N-acetyltransferase [Bdellovibrionaceae bacterium]|nr:GNAT family N-acetyltransferase [Pseudobdellovibrionaceae bacterium]
MIEFREEYLPEWIDQILDLHNKTELKRSPSKKDSINQAFKSSFAVVTAWSSERIVGCGRMISDGQMYSGIFDVVIDPEFQKQGLGRQIMERLISKAPHTCIHLTSTFGNEEFYKKIGFKFHKTALALYPGKMSESPYLEQHQKQDQSLEVKEVLK